jgi:hypothetical protein
MRRFSIICVLLLLSGCHNAKEFSRPSPETLHLGQMTKQEVLSIYGDPTREETTALTVSKIAQDSPGLPSDLKVIRLTYYYRDPMMVALDPAGNSGKIKLITFDFANDRLFAYNFRSTFRDDTSNFDEKKTTLLESGKTTRDDVVALFGQPTGRSVFPAAAPGVEVYTYDFSVTGQFRRINKRLDVAVGGDGIVQTFNLVQETVPVYRGGDYVAPIIIPRSR